MTKPRVLFLCTGNSARSQMAEGLLRHHAADRLEVVSAGTEPSTVHPLAIAAMREVGIDIAHHRSKPVADFLGEHFAYLITVCDNAKEHCPVFPGAATRLHWPLRDPAAVTGTDAERRAAFGRIRDEIDARIRSFLATGVDSRA
jgi:arsenate reductase